jgi:hypothetical protein
MLRLFGQVISLDERNALEVGAEYASGKQSRHACTDHDGVASVWRAGKLQGRFDAIIHCEFISQPDCDAVSTSELCYGPGLLQINRV